MELKIGTRVKWMFSPTISEYEIIASTETPYMQYGANAIYPKSGCDFVLREFSDKEFTPYSHVRKEHLTIV